MTPDPHPIQEEQVLRSAQQGSLEAFKLLYEMHFPRVFRRVSCLVPREDVEDVTQEIFLAVMRSLKGFRGEAKFSTWLFTIANRQVAEYYRRRRQPGEAIPESLPAPHDPVGRDEAINLRQALATLPEKYQEVLLLRFVEQMHFEEMADQLGVSLEAVKSLFRRAVAALQKSIRSDER